MITIGQRIKDRRKDLNMSVEELANQLGKNRATIYRYEKGEIENLPIDVLEPLSIALETTPQYLMGWSDELRTRWNETFTPGFFTDEEYEKLFEYAKFLLSQRDKHEE